MIGGKGVVGVFLSVKACGLFVEFYDAHVSKEWVNLSRATRNVNVTYSHGYDLVGEWVKAGLVGLDEHDGRSKRVVFTRKGLEVGKTIKKLLPLLEVDVK